MQLVLNAISIVVTIFLMMMAGFIGAKKKWFGENPRPLFSFLVVKFGLPCMILNNITTSYTRESLSEGAFGLLIPLSSLTLLWILATVLYKTLKINRKRRGVFIAMCVFSNSVFVGVPISTAIFGETAVPYALLYYIANTLIFWTAGIYMIRTDNPAAGVDTRVFSLETLKNMFNLPLVTFLVSALLVFLNIQLPKPLLDVTKYMGNLVTPMSMLFIGTVLAGIDFKKLKLDKGLVVAVLCRFIAAPALVVVCSLFIPVGTLTRDVFIVQAAMPVMTQVSILSGAYGGDVEYATVGTTLTTLASLAVIPVISLILPYL